MSVELRVLTDGIGPKDLDALRGLEARTVETDGGRLKLEWGAIMVGRVKTAALAVDESGLIGYLGRDKYGDSTPELAGMVDPARRRRGVGAMLLDTVLDACAELGDETALLIVPRSSTDGARLAQARGGRLEHSEHSLRLRGDAGPAPSHDEILLRQARPEDLDAIAALMSEGFGHPHRPSEDDLSNTYVVTGASDLIGTIRLTREDSTGYVHGFTIQGVRRGRGIGRDILRRSVGLLHDQGAAEVRLEVDVDNEGALGLYTSLGFEPVLTEDYYELPTRGDAS